MQTRETCSKKVGQCLGSTFTLLKNMITPATTLAVALVADEGVEIARALEESPLKDQIKRYYALTSSTANAGNASFAAWEFIQTVMHPGIWRNLNWGQRALILTAAGVATLGTAYSMSVFGVEEHIRFAGAVESSSVFLLNTASSAASFFVRRNLAETANAQARGLLDASSESDNEAPSPRA